MTEECVIWAVLLNLLYHSDVELKSEDFDPFSLTAAWTVAPVLAQMLGLHHCASSNTLSFL